MSEALAQAQAVMEQPMIEDPAQKSAGVMDNVYNFLREHPLVAKLAVGIGMLTAGGATELAMANTAEADTFHWSNVGGAPLVPGGIHSASQADSFLESPKGHHALRAEGLNAKEVSAVEQAVKQTGTRSCNIPAGRVMDSMVSADFSVAHNVVLDDPQDPNGVPGFCVKAVRQFNRNGRRVTETINEAVAGPCGNALEVSKHFRSTPIRHPRHPHKPKAPVFGGKVFKDANGDVIRPFPTGVVEEEIKCRTGKDTIDRKVRMMHPVELLARCNVGSIATVSETVIVHPEDWTPESDTTQRIKVRLPKGKKKNIVSFINRQVRPQTPPPTNVPPKDGTQGPGAGTPGQPGGPGAGGQPGNTGEGAPCYDDASTTNGDLNPATSGDILYGTPDQFGNCVGPAQPMTSS